MEARSTHLHSETWEGPGTILFLSAHKSSRHDGKFFEKILLSGILSEVSGRGLLCDEQFGFRPKHSTSLQVARLVERVSTNLGEKRLTDAVFIDVAKAFDTV